MKIQFINYRRTAGSDGLLRRKNNRILKTKYKICKNNIIGLKESHPHDVIITEEAPNYQMGQILELLTNSINAMHKVLVFAYYYPPMGLSGVQRTLKFTKYMKLFNWKPTVITADDVAYFAHDE